MLGSIIMAEGAGGGSALRAGFDERSELIVGSRDLWITRFLARVLSRDEDYEHP